MMLRRMLAAGAIAATAAVAAGCGSSHDTSGTSAASGGSPTTVKLMVGGLDKQIYLPAMLAQRLGYYKQQGLNVELSPRPSQRMKIEPSTMRGIEFMTLM